MSRAKSSTRIGVTLGDPSGIGPEIVARALCALPANKLSRMIVFGDENILHGAYDRLGKRPSVETSIDFDGVLSDGDVVPGRPNEATGRAQVAYLEAAAAAANAGSIAGLVTAPISKRAVKAAGFAFPGHTEFLASRLGAQGVAMMFAGPRLNVVLATVHEALRDVPSVLTAGRILSAIRLAARSLHVDFGMRRPRIGVLGFNPHAGEGGQFGDEEARVIQPAIAQAREDHGDDIEIVGPLVPDAAFRMPFDCFVAMYHDQGLIPVKLIDFDEAVNMTLGLPIVRTSPDHGVAYDIAGQGRARATSMSAAIELAFRIVDQRETSLPRVS